MLPETSGCHLQRPPFAEHPHRTSGPNLSRKFHSRSQSMNYHIWRDASGAEKGSVSSILAGFSLHQVAEKPFGENWKHLVQAVAPHLQFSNYMVRPVTQTGLQLSRNPAFIIYWLEVMRTCPYVCFPVLVSHVVESYISLGEYSQELHGYVQQQQLQQGSRGKGKVMVNKAALFKKTETLDQNINYQNTKSSRLQEQMTQGEQMGQIC